MGARQYTAGKRLDTAQHAGAPVSASELRRVARLIDGARMPPGKGTIRLLPTGMEIDPAVSPSGSVGAVAKAWISGGTWTAAFETNASQLDVDTANHRIEIGVAGYYQVTLAVLYRIYSPTPGNQYGEAAVVINASHATLYCRTFFQDNPGIRQYDIQLSATEILAANAGDLLTVVTGSDGGGITTVSPLHISAVALGAGTS
jgi:hypothetical protein